MTSKRILREAVAWAVAPVCLLATTGAMIGVESIAQSQVPVAPDATPCGGECVQFVYLLGPLIDPFHPDWRENQRNICILCCQGISDPRLQWIEQPNGCGGESGCGIDCYYYFGEEEIIYM